MRRPLLRATLLGTALQGGLVAAGHLLPGLLEANLYPVIGTTIAVVTGFLCGLWDRGATLPAAGVRGGLAAAIAAAIGMAAGFAVGQVPLNNVGVAAGTAGVTGLFGGVVGRLRDGRRG